MPVKQSTTFVFWGYRCDEVAAVTYSSGLRRLGLRVQVVGIAVHGLEGVYGVTLQPDLLLNDALRQAKKAICVILPCDDAALRRFLSDDRLQSFLQTAWSNGAQFVTQDETEEFLQSLLPVVEGSGTTKEIMTYSVGDELVTSVNHLALQLLAKVSKRQKSKL